MLSGDSSVSGFQPDLRRTAVVMCVAHSPGANAKSASLTCVKASDPAKATVVGHHITLLNVS